MDLRRVVLALVLLVLFLPSSALAAGPGEHSVEWTWQQIGDMTLQLVVVSVESGAQYRWILSNVTTLGIGQTFTYSFDRTGEYVITLEALFQDNETLQSSQTISVVATTIPSMYLPVFLLGVLFVWFVVLILAGVYKSDAGKMLAIVSALGFAVSAAYLYYLGTPGIRPASVDAFTMYSGTLLLAIAGGVKPVVGKVISGGLGLALLISVYFTLV